MEYDYSRLLGKMREKGFTQANLADKIGVSETTLNFKLANKRDFRQDEILFICKALEVPPADIPAYFFYHKTLEI